MPPCSMAAAVRGEPRVRSDTPGSRVVLDDIAVPTLRSGGPPPATPRLAASRAYTHISHPQ
jgi:hypothetical protein